MAWTVKVQLDADKNDVGIATATWNAGQPDEFVYTNRGSADEIDKFVTAAKAALVAYQTQAATEAGYAATIEGGLNGTN
jgi:hypothetical protein